MKFLIVTHVQHKKTGDQIYGYGPYIKEMNLWLKHVDEVKVVAPIQNGTADLIDLPYKHEKLTFSEVPAFHLTSKKEAVKTLFKLPVVFVQIVRGMVWADHIHLRCPGNMGLLGSVAQIFFPHKPKTAKYAGNWDPDSPQPWSYRLQKKILSNTFLTRNMKVLVYGEWPEQSSNIVPFFTATYSEEEVSSFKFQERASNFQLQTSNFQLPTSNLQPPTSNFQLPTSNLLYVGALSPGKRPLLSIQTAERLHKEGYEVHLDLFGEGVERPKLESYIKENGLEDFVVLHGNQDADTVKRYYQNAHFLIFVSKSEGWPKVVAEAMFWGCLPITTDVSCVNYMIGNGSRGKIVMPNVDDIVNKVKYYLENADAFRQSSEEAMTWSRQFTLEKFEEEIGKLLYGN